MRHQRSHSSSADPRVGNELIVDAVSDDEGRFQLNDLPAGQWRVTVAKGGYTGRSVNDAVRPTRANPLHPRATGEG